MGQFRVMRLPVGPYTGHTIGLLPDLVRYVAKGLPSAVTITPSVVFSTAISARAIRVGWQTSEASAQMVSRRIIVAISPVGKPPLMLAAERGECHTRLGRHLSLGERHALELIEVDQLERRKLSGRLLNPLQVARQQPPGHVMLAAQRGGLGDS